jgi:hypothetical protein
MATTDPPPKMASRAPNVMHTPAQRGLRRRRAAVLFKIISSGGGSSVFLSLMTDPGPLQIAPRR